MNQHVAPSMISGSAQPFHTFMPQSAPVSPMRSHPSEPQSTVSHMAIRAPDAAIKLDDAFMRDLNTLQNASVADSTTDSRSRGSTQSWASNPILAAAAAPPLPSGSVEATLRGIQAPAPSPMPASSAPPAAGQATAAAKGPTSRSRAPSASADGGKRSRAASSAAPPVDGRRSRAASTSKAADAATSRQGVREDDLLDELEDDGEGAANATKSFGLASMATVEPELKAVMDPIFLEFLADICSNCALSVRVLPAPMLTIHTVDATDSRGDHIHQTLMAKKMMKLDESDDFRPFKFRIQAFTSAFIERLLERGFEEGQIPLKKVRQYLWTQNYISRYNEDGKKAKSKGNHIWTIEAKKMGDRKWMFREFTRCLKGAAPTVAYVDEEWSWSPRIWCPQSSTAGIQAHFTSPALPSWLSWEEGTLTGVAPESDLGMTYEVTAIVTYERGDQLERLEASALFKVCTQDQSAEGACLSPSRGDVALTCRILQSCDRTAVPCSRLRRRRTTRRRRGQSRRRLSRWRRIPRRTIRAMARRHRTSRLVPPTLATTRSARTMAWSMAQAPRRRRHTRRRMGLARSTRHRTLLRHCRCSRSLSTATWVPSTARMRTCSRMRKVAPNLTRRNLRRDCSKSRPRSRTPTSAAAARATLRCTSKRWRTRTWRSTCTLTRRAGSPRLVATLTTSPRSSTATTVPSRSTRLTWVAESVYPRALSTRYPLSHPIPSHHHEKV